MRHMAVGTVAGLGVTALLALGLPARAQSGSGTSAPSTSGQSSDKSGSSSSGSSTMGSGGGNSDTAGAGSSSNKSGSDTGTSHKISGKVEKYDKGSKELTLSNSDKKLKLNDDTQVTKNGQKASTSDIHEGDDVRASYSGSGDPVDVVVIEIVPADTGSSGTGK